MTDRLPFPGCPLGLHPELRRRQDDEPLGYVEMPSGQKALLATRYADTALVLTDPRFSRNLSYPGAPRMHEGFDILADEPSLILNLDPPEHTRLRRLISGAF